LLVVLLVLIGSYGRQSSALQGQAELATVQTTLGALRTSLVIEYLQKHVRGGGSDVAPMQRNPFKVLDVPPTNYAGEVRMSDVASVPPGSWVYDTECACIGYRAQNPQWLEPAKDPSVIWFRVSPSPGPLQLTAMETYHWQGQTVN
jgi:hypothetical protein